MKLLAIATSLVVAASIGVETVSAAGYSYVRGGATGTSQATRYWDCCKPSCGWNGKAKVSSPVKTCAKNGVSIIGNNVQSGCGGGGTFIVQLDVFISPFFNACFSLLLRCLCL